MSVEKETDFECGFPGELCENCPVMEVIHEDWHEVVAARSIMHVTGELLVGKEGRIYDELIEKILGGESEEAVKVTTVTRQKVAELLDGADAQLSQLEEDAVELSGSCDGPLAMRAKKHGTTYVVRICTSSVPHESNPTIIAPAEITRTHAED